jgi:hypothetical protein
VSLYQQETLWQRLRDAALDRLRRENDCVDYAAAITHVLSPPTADRVIGSFCRGTHLF